MNLAVTMERAGRLDEGIEQCQEALAILAPTEHELDKVRVELTMGTIYMHLERWSQAEEAYLRAYSPALRRSGNAYLACLAANNLGSVYLAQGRLYESQRILQKSIQWGRRSQGRLMLANSLGSMAETMIAMGRKEEACKFLEEAVTIAADYPDDGWGRALYKQYSVLREENLRAAGEKV
jgi:tetratricopeptide (TPR) repeat protein